MDRKNVHPRSLTISAEHKVTLPAHAMLAAGLRGGDRLIAEPRGHGRVLLIREEDLVARHAGTLTEVYWPGELDELRGEWR